LELVASPYPQFTQFDLSMRRKAEVLKYKATKCNTKTNNLTKAEKYAQLINGISQRRNYSVQSLENSELIPISCPNDDALLTPTSSCDVPGEIIYLYENAAIPLYNYATNTDAYTLVNPKNDRKWITFLNNNEFYSQNNTNFFTLYIDNNIESYQTLFEFRMPCVIHLESSSGIVANTTIIEQINTAYLYVYYNSTLIITTNPNENVIPKSAIKPTVQISNLLPISITTANNTNQYSASMFSGMITVSDMILESRPTFIYDIWLVFGITTTPTNSGIQKYVYIGNNLPTKTQISDNCVINSSPSSEVYADFSFSGRKYS
jgi:hypothetical protein